MHTRLIVRPCRHYDDTLFSCRAYALHETHSVIAMVVTAKRVGSRRARRNNAPFACHYATMRLTCANSGTVAQR
jgi:hypothetical protein